MNILSTYSCGALKSIVPCVKTESSLPTSSIFKTTVERDELSGSNSSNLITYLSLNPSKSRLFWTNALSSLL